jgi:signal transduction histidine kinase
MYGERDDPYAVLSRLGQRLDETPAPNAVLPAVVETVATALKLPYAAIVFDRGVEPGAGEPATANETPQALDVVAAYGQPVAGCLSLPLTYQHETLGRFLFAPRAPGEPFAPTDLRLLADIARAAGAALHAVRLSADLQRSRERIVTAREEERRRIRRDLHDGLGPELAALTLKLDAARNLVEHEPATTKVLLTELRAQTQAALADIRSLVYGLRPPALDELGLIPALREYAHQLSSDGLHIAVDAEPFPPLSAAAEVATYRIVTEALTNVLRHARAHQAHVQLSNGDALTIEIADDGDGLPPNLRAGVGLTSMRERAEELGGTFAVESRPGGGTRVLARLPRTT